MLSVVAIAFLLLFTDKCSADFVIAMSLAAVMIAGIVTTTQGPEGFSSSAVLSVAILYVVARECLQLVRLTISWARRLVYRKRPM